MDVRELKKELEGIYFALGKSLNVDTAAKALDVGREEIILASEELSRDYEDDDRGIRLVRLEDSFQMCTARDIYPSLIRIAKQPKKAVLTNTLLETLSIIAYRQPVTRSAITRIRGVNSDRAINKLIEYDLIEEVGRMEAPGRPILFGTTEEFLRVFGIDSLSSLPELTGEQIEEFKKEADQEALSHDVDV
ncbi:SMC-Scp complex subunit ScpB [Candidatus Weimeria sp. HCP3S3_B5]|uniref:SMC-Scp complex subunit ScpB n=1 Tax=Candidatus Weimeria sp. HCP3S3_B5 TaxID=3438871 RepID=UPI002A969250|nr:SMC-Scp complex subunit ScpB [Lachnospiraceae bacterium]MDY6351661.1 SMC-Scp complex subunit ScpB [Lachnospiraceae bacterium]